MIKPVLNQVEYKNKIQFKGNVSTSVIAMIQDGIKNDCFAYSETLAKKRVEVDKNSLIAIKDKWVEILQIFKEKAKLMHKDTQIEAIKKTSGSYLSSKPEISYDLRINNTKLKESIIFQNIYDNKGINAENVRDFANNLSPADIDKQILQNASKQLFKKTSYCQTQSLTKEYKSLLEYKDEAEVDERISILDRINLNIKKKTDKEFMENYVKQQRFETDKIVKDLLKDVK